MVYLRDKSMKFRLVNLDVRPEFAIWKAWDRRGDEVKDSAGNVMKFPVRDGVLTNSKGELKEVTDLRFMPNKDFKEQYPTLARKFSFCRQVVVGGVEYTYRFTITANNRLKEKIFDLQTMGKDPLNTEFELKHDASKSASEQYSLKISAIDLPPVQSVQPSTLPTVSAGKSKEDYRERDIVDAIKSVFGKEAPVERFMDIMKKNLVNDDKAKQLYEEYKKWGVKWIKKNLWD